MYDAQKHTGFGEDISPAFKIENMSHKAVSIAIIMMEKLCLYWRKCVSGEKKIELFEDDFVLNFA